jgi:hypothetical protein
MIPDDEDIFLQTLKYVGYSILITAIIVIGILTCIIK